MKILFTIGNMKKGGAERVIANLINSFIQKNKIILVLTTTEKIEYELNAKTKIYTLDKEKNIGNFIIRNIKRINSLKKIIKEEHPDIMISFLPEPSYRLMLVKPKKIPAIISVRNDPTIEYKTFFQKSLMKILYSKADGFVFQTPQAQFFFPKKFQEKSTIIVNPIKQEFLCDRYTGIREKSIVNVGRLTSQKNQKLLIDAFSLITKKYDDYILKIYGTGNMMSELKEYTKKLKINNKVKFMGETKDIKNEIYKSGIFVLSSNYEGLPNSLMEAMAMGIPSISSDCPSGGPSFLMNGENNGLLFEVGSLDSLTNCIEKLINNQKLCNKLSSNANKFTKKFSAEEISKEWMNYIDKVLKEHNKI